ATNKQASPVAIDRQSFHLDSNRHDGSTQRLLTWRIHQKILKIFPTDVGMQEAQGLGDEATLTTLLEAARRTWGQKMRPRQKLPPLLKASQGIMKER
ncbi:hypothetical protein QTP70_033177, partial [Hemibagrus guttatus]